MLLNTDFLKVSPKLGDILHYATDICTFPEVNLSALWFWSMGCKCIIENNIVVAVIDWW